MIAPIIHYCWFGKKPLPPLAQQCLSSWRQHCPDYEIILWDESNSSKYFNAFCEQALREKQYAFVADCVRVKALQEYGGFYLDTDLLLVRPIDKLRKYQFFSAYEVPGRVAYGFFGGRKQHRFFNLMAEFYDENYFNRYSLPVITHTFKAQIQDVHLQEGELLFPPEFCYPMPYEKRDQDPQQFVLPNTYGIHLWDHSWSPDKKEGLWWLLMQFLKVHQDYYFYNYPKAYLKRYRKGFARRIYHKLIGKSSD